MPILLFLLLFAACGSPQSPNARSPELELTADTLSNPTEPTATRINWADYEIRLEPADVPYAEVRTAVLAKKESLHQDWKQNVIDLDSVGHAFTELLVNRLMPYWYGTPWAYEGHTDVPNEGEIACGYLVSTTLKHLGLNLNRYRLAQQAALVEARTLALGEPIISMLRADLADVVLSLRTDFADGLYLVGLDYHVGLILIRKGEPFFIHSSLYDPMTVVIEPAADSEALLYNENYYFAPLSTNPKLMQAWLEGTYISIRE